MISFEIDECTGVLTVQPEGKLEARDFMDLSQTVDPYIEKRRWVGRVDDRNRKISGMERL